MRDIFVIGLIKEVLGPRDGANEFLPQDPKKEYITGCLSPQGTQEEELESDVLDLSNLSAESSPEDEDENGVSLVTSLHPKEQPRSMGVSFLVGANRGQAKFRMCLTWAKYVRETMILPREAGQEEQRILGWRRTPRGWVSGWVSCERSEQIFRLNGSGIVTGDELGEVYIKVAIRNVGSNRLVAIYFVNAAKNDKDRPRTEDFVFQPQIRIIFGEETKSVPQSETDIPGVDEDEEKMLEFLYINRPVFARGHFCSAIWKNIDPERTSREHFHKNELNPQKACSFLFWNDWVALPESERESFICPDIRTEFVPLYQMSTPELDWDNSYGDAPEFRASTLCHLSGKDDFKNTLTPLVEAYSKWTISVEHELERVQAPRNIRQKIIENCNDFLRKLKKGINFLYDDEFARIAFCFANKAMSLQFSWDKKRELVWRPFQLAFLLSTIESVANRSSSERNICDLLWIQTGGGKTEAYLGLSAFSLAYRRLRAKKDGHSGEGGGVGIISRYTLRLLTIQQFRRTLKLITACELLRVDGLGQRKTVGWLPNGVERPDGFFWGSSRFSIGLWVGGQVTPNKLPDSFYNGHTVPGAISILEGTPGDSEPAQIINCPVCESRLSVPSNAGRSGEQEEGLEAQKNHKLFLTIRGDPSKVRSTLIQIGTTCCHDTEIIKDVAVRETSTPHHFALELTLKNDRKSITDKDVDRAWTGLHSKLKEQQPDLELIPIRASRPGYFLEKKLPVDNERTEKTTNFHIYCPNPACELNSRNWAEGVPGEYPKSTGSFRFSNGITLELRNGLNFRSVLPFVQFVEERRVPFQIIANRIPIPAITVDEQIYHNPPSFLVATVDKFARIPFEARASSLFGNIENYSHRYGYYRPEHAAQSSPQKREAHPDTYHDPVAGFEPPDLIIQDELHLIEGPLGSMTGLYECAIDYLSSSAGSIPKYVASTATARNASTQVKSLFNREVFQFPPAGTTMDDRFFIRSTEIHPSNDEKPGRLYLGICAPGKGGLTPLVRIWSRLLQTAYINRDENDVDGFLTLVGYFNSIRELAGARTLYRQDIPERVRFIGQHNMRELPDDAAMELSGRTDSTVLPVILEKLEKKNREACDALFTTSMFGTGVDISRLGLMVVNGQPKTSSSYIQATGRVGRSRGALVVTVYNSARPRDLSHYEFFCGYHRALYKAIEPVTVAPFSQGALDRGIGPVIVGILRNMRTDENERWDRDDAATRIASQRGSPTINQIIEFIERRGATQPVAGNRRPDTRRLAESELDKWRHDDVGGIAETTPDLKSLKIRKLAESELDKWRQIAETTPDLKWVDYFGTKTPVVLGDPAHRRAIVVFENAPQSMREVEETISVQTEDRRGS